MLLRVARRNLVYDKRRFVASIAGVSFSVTLVMVQLGLFQGLAANASQLIDRSPGEIWITGRNTGNFQWGQPIPRRTLTVVRSTPGVAWAGELIAGWTQLRHPEGGVQQLEVIGFDPEFRVGAPWNVVAGSLDELSIPGRIVLDGSSMKKVGPFRVGDYREVFGRRVRIAAMTEGITSFTTVPFVFSSLDTARALTAYIGPDDTVYVVVGLEPAASPEGVVAALRGRLPHLDVFRREAFSSRTRGYWMFETGMGIGFLLTSALAIAVGTVIVSQNIYAATTEHFEEYGTLKAMGISDRGLAGIVVAQGLIAGLAGSLPGCLLGAAVVEAIRRRGLEAALTPELTAITILAALVTCAFAAGTSVRRVWKLEPAMVFRT
jgi:putative ABC transport system permease protein